MSKIDYRDSTANFVNSYTGKLATIEEKLEHVLHVDNLPELSFNHTNSSLMYDLIERAE